MVIIQHSKVNVMKLKHICMVLVLLLLDQITKIFINATMAVGESIEMIPGFFKITNVHNTGAAWSMFEGKMIFFYIISVVFLVAMVYFYHSEEADKLTKIGIVLMIAGTLGNFVDRLFLQYVRDFIDFVIIGYDFPVFNVADMSLCIGVGVVLLSVYLESIGGYRKCAK